MFARLLTYLALCAGVLSRDQPQARIYLDVSDDSGDVEKRYTPELIEELRSVKSDTLLLFTEYTGQAGTELRTFLRNISCLTQDTVRTLDKRMYECAPERCRSEFLRQLKKIENDVHRAGSFSAENHQKFFLSHMVVFRIHLNKSEEYVHKCEKTYNRCGVPCENSPLQKRWRKCALNEMNRVRDDIIHSRRAYKDLLQHFRRRLNHFRKTAGERAWRVAATLESCARHG